MLIVLPFQENPLQSPGDSDSMIMYALEIVILLLGAFILGWLISYLTYRIRKAHIKEMATQIHALKSKLLELSRENERIQKELVNAQLEKSELEEQWTKTLPEKEDLASGVWEGNAPVAIQPQWDEIADSKEVPTTNDLSSIEGIDAKAEILLHDAGIHSLVHLANSSIDHLKKLVENAGKDFQDYNPESWPGQAKAILNKSK